MPSDQFVFAGIDFASRRKPVTLAALDGDLNIISLETWGVPEALSRLREYENIWLAVNVPSRGQEMYTEFKKRTIQAGFNAYSSRKNDGKQWLETNTQDCFRALIGRNPLPRRTLEGRLQRSAVLYEYGLQINDPMEIFEEITRYKLLQGILPIEDLYSWTELGALVGAYLSWMVVNRPGQIVVKADFVLPALE